MAEIVAEFMDWQDKFGDTIRLADGLDLRRARGRSPAFPLVKWSLGSQFAITLAHERRHLWQARQVRNAVRLGFSALGFGLRALGLHGLQASGSRLRACGSA